MGFEVDNKGWVEHEKTYKRHTNSYRCQLCHKRHEYWDSLVQFEARLRQRQGMDARKEGSQSRDSKPQS